MSGNPPSRMKEVVDPIAQLPNCPSVECERLYSDHNGQRKRQGLLPNPPRISFLTDPSPTRSRHVCTITSSSPKEIKSQSQPQHLIHPLTPSPPKKLRIPSSTPSGLGLSAQTCASNPNRSFKKSLVVGPIVATNTSDGPVAFPSPPSSCSSAKGPIFKTLNMASQPVGEKTTTQNGGRESTVKGELSFAEDE